MEKNEDSYIDNVIKSWEKQIETYKKHLEKESVTPILRKIIIGVIQDKEQLLNQLKDGREKRRQNQEEQQG